MSAERYYTTAKKELSDARYKLKKLNYEKEGIGIIIDYLEETFKIREEKLKGTRDKISHYEDIKKTSDCFLLPEKEENLEMLRASELSLEFVILHLEGEIRKEKEKLFENKREIFLCEREIEGYEAYFRHMDK